MNFFNDINTAVVRLLLFPHQLRKYFFTLLQQYRASNFPLIEILSQMERTGANRTIIKISRLARANVRNQECFALNFSKSGFFTRVEEKLLILGENYDSLDNVIRIILQSNKFRAIPIQLLKDSFQWLVMTLLIIVLSNVSSNSMRRIAGTMEWFFDLTARIAELTPPLLFLSIIFIIVYLFLRSSGNVIHKFLRSFGIFSLHEQITEHKLLQVSSELTATNIPPTDLMFILLDIFHTDLWLTQRIRKAQRKLKEESLLTVLENVISINMYQHILASAPNQQPNEISRGMKAASNLLELQIEQKIGLSRLLCTLLTMSIAGAATIPFLLITMGMTAQMSTS